MADARRRRRDDLGLKRALGDRMLPLLVAAMTFLAALALAGAMASAALVAHWREGAASSVTVQVPRATVMLPKRNNEPEETRLDAVMRALQASPDVADARLLGAEELAALLRPWLGSDLATTALPLPAVIAVRLATDAGSDRLGRVLAAAVPGTLTESHGVWVGRLAVLARSLQACAWAALLVVVLVAAAVVMIATRAGMASRREAIETVHGLGATDGYIAGRFARRVTRMAALGGLVGAIAALPVLLLLASLAAPFMPGQTSDTGLTDAVSVGLPLWLALLALPIAAGALGFLTAQVTVRRWLRKLP